jgi:hypothetical protein
MLHFSHLLLFSTHLDCHSHSLKFEMDYNTDDSMDINNDRELSASTNDNNKTGPRSCVICGANAAGVNFSALTVSKAHQIFINEFSFFNLVYSLQSIFSSKWS